MCRAVEAFVILCDVVMDLIDWVCMDFVGFDSVWLGLFRFDWVWFDLIGFALAWFWSD